MNVTLFIPHNIPSFKSLLQSKARLTFEFITWRVLSNHEIPYQALILQTKTSNKENYKNQKVKVTMLDDCHFCENDQIGAFPPAKEEWSPTTNPQHRDVKLAAGHYLGAVSVLRKRLPPTN